MTVYHYPLESSHLSTIVVPKMPRRAYEWRETSAFSFIPAREALLAQQERNDNKEKNSLLFVVM